MCVLRSGLVEQSQDGQDRRCSRDVFAENADVVSGDRTRLGLRGSLRKPHRGSEMMAGWGKESAHERGYGLRARFKPVPVAPTIVQDRLSRARGGNAMDKSPIIEYIAAEKGRAGAKWLERAGHDITGAS